MNQYNMPLYDALIKYTKMNKIPFHMPGHKQGRGIPTIFKQDLFRIDLTEIDGTDNLHAPEGSILKAQNLAAKAFGAKHSFFLVNGSTCGIQTMIASVCNPGDELIIDRNSHSSVISALILCDVTPRYIFPEYIDGLGVTGGIKPDSVEKALKQYPKAKAVLITSPNYYGLCSDLKKIADIVHRYDKVFMVDEAHGAHFHFHNELPKTAMESGADLCVQSAHKTLPALTQSSLLHVNSERVDLLHIRDCLKLFQSTSPSFILMAYLDLARSIMEYEGKEILGKLISWSEMFKTQIGSYIGFYCFDRNLIGKFSIGHVDLTRIVVNFHKLGVTGYQVARILNKEYNIQVEMADFQNIVAIPSPGTDLKEFQTFATALEKILKGSINNNAQVLRLPYSILETAISPRAAFYSPYEFVSMKSAIGRISSATVVSYPPCIPIIYPGEVISQDIVNYITEVQKAGGKVLGLETNGYLGTVRGTS